MVTCGPSFAVIGDFQFDAVVADVPFLHDLVMLAHDRVKERCYARADCLDPDHGLAVAEDNPPVLGERDVTVATFIASTTAKRLRVC
jgi:hypothetical protein